MRESTARIWLSAWMSCASVTFGLPLSKPLTTPITPGRTPFSLTRPFKMLTKRFTMGPIGFLVNNASIKSTITSASYGAKMVLRISLICSRASLRLSNPLTLPPMPVIAPMCKLAKSLFTASSNSATDDSPLLLWMIFSQLRKITESRGNLYQNQEYWNLMWKNLANQSLGCPLTYVWMNNQSQIVVKKIGMDSHGK